MPSKNKRAAVLEPEPETAVEESQELPVEEAVSDPPESAETADAPIAKNYRVKTVERVTRYYHVPAESIRDARSKFPFSVGEETGITFDSEELRGGHVHEVRWER